MMFAKSGELLTLRLRKMAFEAILRQVSKLWFDSTMSSQICSVHFILFTRLFTSFSLFDRILHTLMIHFTALEHLLQHLEHTPQLFKGYKLYLVADKFLRLILQLENLIIVTFKLIPALVHWESEVLVKSRVHIMVFLKSYFNNPK